MTDFLLDKSFLLKVNQHKVREYQAAIMVLDFETENPIARLEGKVVSGSMSVAANSAVRKTCNLQLVFDKDTLKITDINNLIAINKKIALSIGFNNPFYHTEEYNRYGEVLWFKQGTFFITKASSSISTSSMNVAVELQDKMAGLNGTCGGTLPASVSFHDRIIIDGDGNYTTEYPIISQIIKECVHHYGGEHFSRISVEDVPDVGRIVVRYVGNTPINFQSDNLINSGRSFIIGVPPIPNFLNTYYKGDNVGYMETPLTFPGELILKAGSNVTQVLDEIVKALGNYEYFYDEEGIFHFRQKPNFEATGKTPLNFVESGTVINQDGEEQQVSYDSQLQNLYLPKYTADMAINEFADASLVQSVAFNPNYSNIKNDFIVWGSRNADENTTTMVRYHLAVDKRPKDIRAPRLKDFVENTPEWNEEKHYALSVGNNFSLCHKNIQEIRDIDTNQIIRYEDAANSALNPQKEKVGEMVAPSLDDVFADLGEEYWFNWREELYRRALLAYGSSTDGSYYDEELMAEWRNIYDPTSTFLNKGAKSFEQGWLDHYGKDGGIPWGGYIVDVKVTPENLRYWLDIIDTTAAFGAYGVNRIGRRSLVQENPKINEVFEAEIPDIVFIENDGIPENMQKNTQYYISIGQPYAFVNPDQMKYFQQRNSFGTCYEDVRAALYNHMLYNVSVNLTTIPVFYLQVNSVIRLNFPELGIVGDFVINNISYQLGGQSNSMSLTLNEAIVVV